jgi:curved DNA-binding protein CbpA
MSDYYTVLGVKRHASRDEIIEAYRRLEADPGNRERLAEIKKAYELLSDPGARDIYDQTLRLRESGPARSTAGGGGGIGAGGSRPTVRSRPPEPESGYGRLWIGLVLALLVVGGLLLYGHFSREEERIRLEREREISLRAHQADEERKQREEAEQARVEEQRLRRETEELERRNRNESERALREADRRGERESMQARTDAEREAYRAERKEQEAKHEEERLERERRERERHNRWILERPALH